MESNCKTTAVVFYSLEGNTRYAAERIAEKLNADLIEIDSETPYPSGNFSKYFWGGKNAASKESPKLKNYTFLPERYDTVILGSPLWAGQIAPPLRTFVGENSLTDKKLAVFITCMGSSPAKAIQDLRTLTGKQELAAELKLVHVLKQQQEADASIAEFCRTIADA